MKPLRLVICGGVDDGKSTLIGRLLYDCDLVFEDTVQSVEQVSRKYGTQGSETDFALLVDGLKAEREQGITIDVAYLNFSTERRRFVVADAPGHVQYTHNMATAASNADLAAVLVDVSKGVVRQTARHTGIVAAFGIRHVVLAVNKMDMVDWDEEAFVAIESRYREIAEAVGIAQVEAFPVSALSGANLRRKCEEAPWYEGPTLHEYFETVDVGCAGAPADSAPFRMPVQYVNRPSMDFRGYCGRVASGSVSVGDRVMVAPSSLETRVASILNGMDTCQRGVAGESLTLTLEDEIDISRGDVLTGVNAPLEIADQFRARLIWMREAAMFPGRAMGLKIHGIEVGATVNRVRHVTDPVDGARPATELVKNDIGTVELSTKRRIPFAPYADSKVLGGFVLIDPLDESTIGAGMIDFAMRRSTNLRWQSFEVSRESRCEAKGQRAQCLWMTGLSGSGKSTIANLLEQRLHLEGRHTYILDGDNVRHGLNQDLGFTEADRVQNIRRVSEVARLMVDAGLIVIVALISPFKSDREMARSLFDEGDFKEIFIDASIETCERRDTKGLYARAKAGELPNLTGIGSPYEPPESPDIRVDTNVRSAEECATQIAELVV